MTVLFLSMNESGMLIVEMRDDSPSQHTLTTLCCEIAAAISLLLCLLKPLVRVIYPG